MMKLDYSTWAFHTSDPQRPLKPTQVFSWPRMPLYPHGCSSFPAKMAFQAHTGFDLFVTEGHLTHISL